MHGSLKSAFNSDDTSSGFGKIMASNFHYFSSLQLCKIFHNTLNFTGIYPKLSDTAYGNLPCKY